MDLVRYAAPKCLGIITTALGNGSLERSELVVFETVSGWCKSASRVYSPLRLGSK